MLSVVRPFKMALRMSDTRPLTVEPNAPEADTDAPRVRVLLSVVPGSDTSAALGAVERQRYEPAPEIAIVAASADSDLPESVSQYSSLEEAIEAADSEIEYLWFLHSDARPRPDALSALVTESERNEASLAGSKLLKAGTMDELESVGGATDVFGEPYSGLDEGEIDLQQYDVVREVAFVRSASMLVRRDLARGLRGLDPKLPPISAGLDFSQRTRLAGGRVITVPSSEVYHQARCDEKGTGWREQAGRLRAMLTAYTPLTLLWVVPYDFLVSIADAIGSLLLLRWRPLVRQVLSWIWNLIHLPSTIGQRRRLSKVRSTGDEEIFRFQASGSVRLREIGSELSGRFLSLFDDDQALSRGTERVWRSPGIWGAVIAGFVVLIGVRSLVFGSLPNTGFAFPLEPPTTALSRWLGGWNESGLGSSAAVHPSVGLMGVLSWLWFGAEGATRTLLTIGAGFIGFIGMGRLAGRIGLRGPGRYLSGLVLMAGPAVSNLVGAGSWLALMAAAILPWAVRTVFVHPSDSRSVWSHAGWALLLSIAIGMVSPTLAVVPFLMVVLWTLARGTQASLAAGAVSLLGVAAGFGFLASDPGWLTDSQRRLGTEVWQVWPLLIGVAGLSLLFEKGHHRRVGMLGALVSLAGLIALQMTVPGPGLEEGLAVLASFGAALVVAAAMDRFGSGTGRLVASGCALAMLVLTLSIVGNGRLGLPQGDVNERFAFATTLAEDEGPGRILHASVDRSTIPGDARSGPGFWYRVLDGSGTTHDEVFLPAELDGDRELDESLLDIATGADLRPGVRLAEFAIDWVVLEGPTFRLDDVLGTQLDLVPTPLDRNARVFENLDSAPLASSASGPWTRSEDGFVGPATSGEVLISTNYDSGWAPDSGQMEWFVTVSGTEGVATYSGDLQEKAWPIATAGLAVLGILAIILARRLR